MKIFLEDALFIVSLEKIEIFSFGNNNLTSSNILSTPDPLNINSHKFAFSHFLFRDDLYPQ